MQPDPLVALSHCHGHTIKGTLIMYSLPSRQSYIRKHMVFVILCMDFFCAVGDYSNYSGHSGQHF